MGFFLFLGIEVVYMIFFVLIVVFASIALAYSKDAKKDASDADKENYKSADYWLGWCIGIGYTLIALGILAVILAGVVAFFTGPEDAVGAGGAALTGEGASLLEGEILLGDIGELKKLYDAAEFNKIEDVLKFVRQHHRTAKDLFNKSDEIYAHLKQQEDGLLKYNKIFGMSGVIGWLEKVILWLSALLLFILSVMAAIAAGYIGRTTEKAGYEYAIWTAVIGIVPFSIMLIWGIANAIYTSKNKKQVIQITNEIRQEEVSPRRGPRRPPPKRSPKRYPKAPRDPKKSPRRSKESSSKQAPKGPSHKINAQKPMDQIVAEHGQPTTKNYIDHGIETLKSLSGHAGEAHEFLDKLSVHIDPNSSSGQTLNNIKDKLKTVAEIHKSYQ